MGDYFLKTGIILSSGLFIYCLISACIAFIKEINNPDEKEKNDLMIYLSGVCLAIVILMPSVDAYWESPNMVAKRASIEFDNKFSKMTEVFSDKVYMNRGCFGRFCELFFVSTKTKEIKRVSVVDCQSSSVEKCAKDLKTIGYENVLFKIQEAVFIDQRGYQKSKNISPYPEKTLDLRDSMKRSAEWNSFLDYDTWFNGRSYPEDSTFELERG